MCDKCDLDLAMYGEVSKGFRCCDVNEDLLAEEANGIARFPNRKKALQSEKAEGSERNRMRDDERRG
ncbi:MAG: hypothetical protein CL534_15295 [Ahrensia sp.]|nr:hypothetical protein [Ahrensia sp.]